MTDAAEFWSLVLTIPTLILSTWVVRSYGGQAVDSIQSLFARESVPSHSLLILGICVGFVGSIVDNLYWGLAWSAEFISHPSRDWLFANGVWSNLPFRQGAGILAATLHLYAAFRMESASRRRYALVWVLTLLLAGPLLFARGYFGDE